MLQFDSMKLLNDAVVLLLQFVAILAGNYIREYFTQAKRKQKIRLGRIVAISLAISIVSLGFSEWLISKATLEIYFTGCFLLGISGEEIIKLLLSGKILKIFGKIFFKNVVESVKEVVNETKK